MFATAVFGESEGQVFISAAAVDVRNIRSQQQAVLRGQIGGCSAAGCMATNSDPPETADDFVQYKHVLTAQVLAIEL